MFFGGATFLIFFALETGLKIDGFSGKTKSRVEQVAVVIRDGLGALNTDYRPSNSSFRTDDC